MIKYNGIRKLMRYLKGNWFKVLLLTIFSLVIGLVYIIPTQLIGLSVDYLSNTELTGYKATIQLNITDSALVLILIAGVFMILAAILDTFFGYWVTIFSENIKKNVRKDLFAKVINNYNSLEEELKEGEVMNRVMGDVNAVTQVIAAPINGLFRELLNIFWISVVFFLWNPALALIALLFTVPIYFVSKKVAAVSSEKFGDIANINDSLYQYFLSIINNHKVIHAHKTYNYEVEKINVLVDDSFTQHKKLSRQLSYLFPILDLFKALGTVAILSYTYVLVSDNVLTPGDLVISYMYIQKFFGPVIGISRYMKSIAAADIALQRAFEVEKFNYKTSNNVYSITKPPRIQFNNVSFKYNENTIFNNFSVDIYPNTINILRAPSGKGKSTFINLLLGLVDNYTGEIKIDEYDIRDVSIRNFGISFQENFLFNRTIEENIKYNARIKNVDEIMTKSSDIGINQLIKDKGLNFILENQALNISGGERKRLSVLRAILGEYNFYIFDEPTIELDKDNSRLVVEYIKKLKSNATIIVATHDDLFNEIADSTINI